MSAACQNSEVIIGPVREVCTLYLRIYRWLTLYTTNERFKDILDAVRQGAGLKDEYDGCNRGYFVETPDLRKCGDGSQCFMVFVTETAWDPVPDLWRDIIKRWAPNCQYYYLSVCVDCNCFVKYDPTGEYFPEEYYVSGFVDDASCLPKDFKDVLDDMHDHDSLLALLQKGFNTKSTDLQELIELFNNIFEDVHCPNDCMYNSLQIYKIEEEGSEDE